MMRAILGSAIVILTISIVLGYIFFSGRFAQSSPCPLPDYASYSGRTEDLLILQGKCVVSTAVVTISDRHLPKRSFVISFLGHAGDREALDPLKSIVEDPTDPNRSSAIIAVFRIDNDEGRRLARKYLGEGGEFGTFCQDILANEDYLYRRITYWQALRNHLSVLYAI